MTTVPAVSFADLLKRYRARAHLSQEGLAERAGLSLRAVSDLERGINRTPRNATIRLLAEALGLSEPERAAFAAAARHELLPSTAAPAATHNLPPQLTSFIGRAQDTAAVVRLLQRPDVRLLTLTGPGGAGKTRLALCVAEALLPSFADGVRFVDLAPIADPRLVPVEMARAVGLKETGSPAILNSVQAYLRDRHLLVVLDNFEQVVSAAPLLARLLAASPRLTLLVTSRVMLRLSGEQLYQVPPLTLPDPLQPVSRQQLGDYEAVRLFLARAQAVKPGFEITPENAPAIAEICRRLDGLPLAIELAAARVQLLSPPAMLARLDNRLALLTRGAQDLPARHQTLRAALDWSYELLSEQEQRLFGALSIFAGDWGLQAAEEVCHTDVETDILERLASLVDKSLLQQRELPGGEARFGMLETVREYALARLAESGEAETVRVRHADYYLRLVERAEVELHGPDEADWLHRLDQEADNVRAALRWAQDSRRADVGLRIAGALGWYWKLRGRLSEGRAWLEGLLAIGGDNARGEARAIYVKALLAAALLAWTQGDLQRAEELATESLALYRAEGDVGGVADALHRLGNVAHERGDHRRAAALFEESLSLLRELEDTRRVAALLNDLGMLARDLGEWARARALHEESLALRRQLGSKAAIAHSLYNLGLAAHLEGDYDSAETHLLEALALFRELGDVLGVADSLNNLGRLPQVRRDWQRATALFEEALHVYRGLSDATGIAWTLNNLGLIAYDRRDYERAAALHDESRWRHHARGSTFGTGIARYDLGNALHALGRYTAANEAYHEALSLLRDAGDKAMIAFCIEGLARIALAEGRLERATRLSSAADALRTRIKAPLPPPDRPLYEATLDAARTALGEDGFAAAWSQGQLMGLEQAIREALGEEAG